MNRIVVVCANASLARFFDRNAVDGAMAPLATLKHPESRLPAHDLAGDRPGHEATDHSPGGNRFEPRTDPRRHEHEKFAREIAESLRARLAAGEFDALWLLASSPFLGELKAALDEAVAGRVRFVHATDLTSLGLAEIEDRLRTLHVERAGGHRTAV